MTTITQADREAAQELCASGWTARMTCFDCLDELTQTLARHREAAEARAREEGAKAMHIELAKAANACMGEYKRGHADGHKRGYNAALAAVYHILHKCGEPCPQCHDAIAALDPAQIVGGGE